MITAIILTKNEEKNIKDCLESLKFCGEIIVVDDNSSDDTVNIAKKLRATILNHDLGENFAEQRNFGLSKAKGDWILFVDADERVSKELADEIIENTWIERGKNAKEFPEGYLISRQDYFWGKKLRFGETASLKFLRLARRDAGKWKRKVHEYWSIKGQIGNLKNPIAHYPHPTLQEFVEEVDFYSTLHANEKNEVGEHSSLIKIIFWPVFKFIQNFIFRLGFLDRVPGVVVTLMMSFHSYLAWSKLYLMQRKSV